MSRFSESIVHSRRMRGHMRAGVLIGALLMAASGCAVKPGTSAAGSDAVLGGGISDEIDALAVVDPTVLSKVDDCVDAAKFKIYTGDAFWRDTWNDIGASDYGLREFCKRMATNDPATLDRIHTEWVAWEAFVAAQNAAPATSPAPLPVLDTAPPSTKPPRVLSDPSGCHPSYTPCVPISLDAECRGDGGNGPTFVIGPVQVIGYDEYGLDPDGDGIGCDRL